MYLSSHWMKEVSGRNAFSDINQSKIQIYKGDTNDHMSPNLMSPSAMELYLGVIGSLSTTCVHDLATVKAASTFATSGSQIIVDAVAIHRVHLISQQNPITP